MQRIETVKPGDLVRVEHQSDFPVALVQRVDDLGVTVKYLCDGLRINSEQVPVKKGDVSVVEQNRLLEVGESESWWREQIKEENQNGN